MTNQALVAGNHLFILKKGAHIFYISALSVIVLVSFVIVFSNGYSYYQIPLEERYFHDDHQTWKSSGIIGHGLGITGSFLIVTGIASYMARKRSHRLMRLGFLKHWLEFHIFLCTLGPILILGHTTFKFGGIVAISFWSMVAVFLSGIVGRFIYIQIPRSIEGRELSLNEIRAMKNDIDQTIRNNYNLSDASIHLIKSSVSKDAAEGKQGHGKIPGSKYLQNLKHIRQVKTALREENLPQKDIRKIVGLIKNEISLSQRIARLNMMQNLFRYWHVAHLPFALVMLIIMVIHIIVSFTFGYYWIF